VSFYAGLTTQKLTFFSNTKLSY